MHRTESICLSFCRTTEYLLYIKGPKCKTTRIASSSWKIKTPEYP